MELSLTYYFLLFMIYSIAGWILEVGCKLVEYKRFINRGFLIGPYCPIYGWGAIAITFLLYRYSYDPLVLFIMTIITCGILEYLTSYVMEKLFKARWWDYSKRKFNLNGRICLGTIIPFGIFGLILTYVTNPLLIGLLDKSSTMSLNIIAISLLILYSIDNVISGIVIFGFRKTTLEVERNEQGDNTEQITKKVREILTEKSWAYKRLINAYPRLVAIKTKIQEITDEVKENAKEIKDNLNEKAEDLKNSINYRAEEVKNNINEKKDEMKASLEMTGKALTDEFEYRKRKAKVKLKLSQRKLKQTFYRKEK